MEYIHLTIDRRVSNMVRFVDEVDAKAEVWFAACEL